MNEIRWCQLLILSEYFLDPVIAFDFDFKKSNFFFFFSIRLIDFLLLPLVKTNIF